MRAFQHSDEEYAALAAQALASRPSPSAMWDDRLYRTHAPIGLMRAINQDDLLADSNYEKVLEYLQAFTQAWEDTATDKRDCLFDAFPNDRGTPHVPVAMTREEIAEIEAACECEACSPSVIDARISDWAYGPIDQLFVRVRWADGTLTQVWREAMDIALSLRDDAVFDESDYSEREWTQLKTDLDQAIHDTTQDAEWRNHPDDSDADRDAIKARLVAAISNPSDTRTEFDAFDAFRSDRLWSAVEKLYAEARSAYFEARAQEMLFIGAAAQMPNQTALETNRQEI